MVVDCNDQHTKGNVKVKKKGYIGFMINGTKDVVSKSNIITSKLRRPSYHTHIMREQRELDGVSL